MGMRQITEPVWMRNLPGNAYLNSQEMVKLFGYSVKTSASHLAKTGSLPKPTRKCERSFHQNLMWKVSEVREFIKQIGEKNGH